MAAQFTIDQAGLPAGTSDVSRTDGLSTGAVVTLTAVTPAQSYTFRLLWTPPEDTTAVATLAPTGNPAVWTFTPSVGAIGTYQIELIQDLSLSTEERSVRLLRVRNAFGLTIPALNEVADPSANLQNAGADVVAASQDNATDYPSAIYNAIPYAGWYRLLDEVVRQVGGGGGGAVASVFGRVGAVVAQLGDYTSSLVSNASGVAGATVTDALDALAAAIPAVPVDSVFGRTGAVTAQPGDYDSNEVNNASTVAGATVSDALDTLSGAIPPAQDWNSVLSQGDGSGSVVPVLEGAPSNSGEALRVQPLAVQADQYIRFSDNAGTGDQRFGNDGSNFYFEDPGNLSGIQFPNDPSASGFLFGTGTNGNRSVLSWFADFGLSQAGGVTLFQIGSTASGRSKRLGMTDSSGSALAFEIFYNQSTQSVTVGPSGFLVDDVSYTGRLLAINEQSQTQAANATIDWTTGHKQRLTLTGNVAIAFTSPGGPTNLTLVLVQDGAGGRTPTWPVSTIARGGSINVAGAPNAVTTLGIYFDGTNYHLESSPDLQGGVTTSLV